MGCCGSSPADNFDIRDAVRAGEDGAGWLFKQGRSVPTLKRRFFVLTATDCTLTYFPDEEREAAKGVLKLGPRASATELKGPEAVKGGKYAFRVSHPHCANRELLAPSRGAMQQWVRTINEVCEAAKASGARQCFMLKRGGVGKNSWQQRWCSFVPAGGALCYYSDPQDAGARGVVELATCTVTATTRDKKPCFELLSRGGGLAKVSI
jgi:hypothetical protein